MKLSVSSYSFARMPGITLFDAMRHAKELGFEAIELVDATKHCGDASPEDFCCSLGEEAKRLGLTVSCYTFGADFLRNDTRAEIERVKKEVALAALTGAAFVRHDAASVSGIFRSFDAALPTLATACREVAAYAQTLGIRTMVENHGFFCQDSDRVERLFRAVDHPNFSLLTDIGNFLCADEDPVTAVSRVAPYAAYVHVKDFHVKSGSGDDPGEFFFQSRGGNYLRGSIIGHGNVPVRQCLQALKRAGYKGWVALEYEGNEDVLTAIRISKQNLERFIG